MLLLLLLLLGVVQLKTLLNMFNITKNLKKKNKNLSLKTYNSNSTSATTTTTAINLYAYIVTHHNDRVVIIVEWPRCWHLLSRIGRQYEAHVTGHDGYHVANLIHVQTLHRHAVHFDQLVTFLHQAALLSSATTDDSTDDDAAVCLASDCGSLCENKWKNSLSSSPTSFIN